MKRVRRGPNAAAIVAAAALSLGGVACAVEKKESTVSADSGRATQSPAAIPTADMNKSAPGVVPKGTPVTGGERDSAGTAVFELGTDGKLRRVKR